MKKIVCLILLIIIPVSSYAKRRWDIDISPGDKVCLYDMAGTDPLFRSLTQSYRSYDNRWRRELRRHVINMEFMVVYPGIKISNKAISAIEQAWWSGTLMITKNGTSQYPNFSLIKFKIARFKKKKFARSCRRKY